MTQEKEREGTFPKEEAGEQGEKDFCPNMCLFSEPKFLFLYHRLDRVALCLHPVGSWDLISHIFPSQVQPDGVTLEYNPYSWNLVWAVLWVLRDIWALRWGVAPSSALSSSPLDCQRAVPRVPSRGGLFLL